MAGTSPAMTLSDELEQGNDRMALEILVSSVAATLTTAAFVPQALHIIRCKETRAISLQMYVAFAIGVAFWLLFGFMIWNWPMIVANTITLALALTILRMKLKYG
jgi:MtN3 and saliva related transmembrane protein